MAKVKWESFKKFMHSKWQKHKEIYPISLSKANTEGELETLKKGKARFRPHELWKFVKKDVSCKVISPHYTKLLYFLLIFPLSDACVERSFSKMKLGKTRLRNQLKQTSLENLLYISTENPKEGFVILFSNILWMNSNIVIRIFKWT